MRTISQTERAMFGDKIEWQHAQTGERRTGVATGVEWQEHNALAVWTPFGITVVHRDNVLAVNDEPRIHRTTFN